MRTPSDRLDRRTVLQGLGAVGLGWAGAAQALDQPRGPVVLTLSGQLRKPNDGRNAHFDMAMLERLPQTSFSTRTPWYAQARKFTGPLLREVLAAAGAHGSLLRAVALNDYWVELPIDDAARHDVVVARLLDDKPMAVRDKGPLFMVYPFDAQPELRNPVYYSRSAWQLRTIEVR
ncbi:hypothetical protein ACPOLB_07950 [Rubrivivax sp. RP6-9]|uniref:hypothetical protein n=1 Tax=Rubrivivax sp. RP6-9 TaxID=3415750 RepID=UPI003CC6A785